MILHVKCCSLMWFNPLSTLSTLVELDSAILDYQFENPIKRDKIVKLNLGLFGASFIIMKFGSTV